MKITHARAYYKRDAEARKCNTGKLDERKNVRPKKSLQRIAFLYVPLPLIRALTPAGSRTWRSLVGVVSAQYAISVLSLAHEAGDAALSE